MANVIKIKRGSGTPTSLEYGEPAFDKLNKKLYIGGENNEVVEVGENENFVIVINQEVALITHIHIVYLVDGTPHRLKRIGSRCGFITEVERIFIVVVVGELAFE